MRALPTLEAARLSLRLLAFCISAIAGIAGARAQSADPAVPTGTDPGGLAVAVISTGIDYTLPQITARLARDGEGEIIGYDFADDDRRPFKQPDDLEGMGYSDRGTAMARTVVRRSPAVRLIPVRIESDSPEQIAQGMGFAAQTPARVVIVAIKSTSVTLWAAVADAAKKAGPKVLFIVAAGENPLDENHIKDHLVPSLASAANILIVMACLIDGNALSTAEGAETNADIAVNAAAFTAELISQDTFSWKPESSIAAAEVAALAARLGTMEPGFNAGQMKAAIINLAKPFADGQVPIAKSGWIAEPWRLFQHN